MHQNTVNNTVNMRMLQGRSGWGVCINQHYQSHLQPQLCMWLQALNLYVCLYVYLDTKAE